MSMKHRLLSVLKSLISWSTWAKIASSIKPHAALRTHSSRSDSSTHAPTSKRGIRCLEDETLTKKLAETKMASTTCPLSDLEFKIVTDIRDFSLRRMMHANLRVTISSDDPVCFGGCMNENYLAIAETLDLTKEDLTKLAINGFQASCMEEVEKKEWIDKVQVCYEQRED
jgi:adenosine deaminase